jgi:hypothetical protein
MTRFLDAHKIGSFTEEQLMNLQKSPPDGFGVKNVNILYNHEANIICCLLNAPSTQAVEMHHAKLGASVIG